MTRITVAIIAAALWLAAPLAAQAAGLGRLTVLSPLGQPLNAEIEVVSLRPGEEEGLIARLASVEAFRQAGIEPTALHSNMRLALEQRGGRSVIRVTTSQPVNEPFLDLLIELQWNAGRLLREYTVLLDPPDYKGPQAVAAAPVTKPAAPLAQPLPPQESKPAAAPEQQPASAPAAVEPPAAEPAPPAPEPAPPAAEPSSSAAPAAVPLAAPPPGAPTSYEVKRGDTLGAIALGNLPPGVTLNQMLIAIYRANPDAFIRENVNLVRAGRILSIPSGDSLGTVDVTEANRLVRAHHAEFNEYRSRLAAAAPKADTAPGERAVEGQIEAKPAAPKPAPAQDQLRLSKADPAKPAAASARAAQEDDAVARERALKEAQSRVADLEKNVADLQKLLELKNQQLAELEKKAAAKPAPAAPPAPITPVPAPAAKAPEAPKPAAKAPEASKPAAPKPEAPKPAPEVAQAAPTPAPAKPAPVPQVQPQKAEPAKPAPAKPAPKKVAPPPPPPPEPSLLDEFTGDPLALGGLGAVLLLLVGYGVWSWRKKKATQARFQDSVLGAAAGGAAFSAAGEQPAPSVSQTSVNQPVAGMEAEEVDPIAEADVYMAYGRDAQAEEILKEALQKDANRVPVHAKLLEIYANRKDTRAFEEAALKVKSLTGGSGAEWDKAAALGRSIDPGNGLYGGAAAAAAAAPAAAAAAAPALDFDLGGGTTPSMPSLPDISLDEKKEEPSAPSSIDFDLGTGGAPTGEQGGSDFTPEGTLIMDKGEPESPAAGGLDFNLDLGGDEKKPAPAPAAPAAAETSGGLDFDLNLDMGGDKGAEADKTAASAPSMDLSDISLDLGSVGEPSAGAGSDPKWQEVATKLDLAKAYEEMGDKDGARELLGEVMKDGDAAQKGQAEQLLAKLS
jgi:pilus assembly protein FimV